jgi:hypothetical protein
MARPAYLAAGFFGTSGGVGMYLRNRAVASVVATRASPSAARLLLQAGVVGTP